jgi:methionyl aminopeptidase
LLTGTPTPATNAVSTKSNAVGGKPRGANMLEDGDGEFGSDDDDGGDGQNSSLAMVNAGDEGEFQAWRH